jgi:GAF domain-containing protein
VTVIDGDLMLTPGRYNSRLRAVDRAESVCGQAILNPDRVLCIPDLQAEARYARLGVARGPQGIRFYAGAPLMSADGHALGMVCALDLEPHSGITEEQRRALMRLAALAVPRLMAMTRPADAA